MNKTLAAFGGAVAAVLLIGGYTATAQHDTTGTQNGDMHAMVTPDDIKWGPAPASLPAGAQATVLEGDPAKAGAFTLRIKMPAGYKVPPHFHPADEHVTVLQGSFYMGLGEKFDESNASRLSVGSFAMMKTGQRHFAFTGNTETIVQLHGIGPWGITYVNPKDDPRGGVK